MMALANITTFYQAETNRWLAEVEVGGLVCKRREVRERTLPEALSAILESYREMATPEMLEAQGMAERKLTPQQEQMARVRAAKAAKHEKEASA